MKLRILSILALLTLALSLAIVTSADGVTKRVTFKRGKKAATMSGAVIRGDRDTYILRAKAGQMMHTKITSLENNAVFTVEAPNGEFLQDAGETDDATNVTNDLPWAGDYKIVVGGTRGNASYKLTVSIE